MSRQVAKSERNQTNQCMFCLLETKCPGILYYKEGFHIFYRQVPKFTNFPTRGACNLSLVRSFVLASDIYFVLKSDLSLLTMQGFVAPT